tara:strand:+ start:169 stop:792 length:624 start_codon:yes stop_codon:yes gene_type:complete
MPQTETLEIHHVQNNAFVNLEVWDFPGEYTLSDSAVTDTKTLSDSNLFDHCGALVYVIDIGTYESSDDVIPTLVEWLTRAYNANPKIHFAVLLHKFDAEKQTSDFAKSDIIDDLDKQVQNMFQSLKIESYDDMNIDYHLTSIYDHTLFELFSQIVQTLFEEHTVLEDLLNVRTVRARSARISSILHSLVIARTALKLHSNFNAQMHT